MYIDIHCHLTDTRYGGDISNIVNRFGESGLCAVVDSGYGFESSVKALENAHLYKSVYCTLGVHPENADELDEKCLEFLKVALYDDKCIGLGEIGLDYHYDGYDKDKQRDVFLKQVELADKIGIPFVVHSRDCSKDMVDFLTANKSLINNGFLLHCYSESKEQAKRYLDLGAYFSFGGVLTFKNSNRSEVLSCIPLDRVLGETDAPYLAPVPFRGQTNYPYYVIYAYKKMAECYNIDLEEFAEKVKNNAQTLFPKLKVFC